MEVNEKGFICCPECGRKTKTKVLPGTRLQRFPLWCPWCKKEIVIDLGKPETKLPMQANWSEIG